jgi:K+-transporting ATPase ATPase C chain
MTGHVRANVFLLLGTLVLCSVLYPAVLWVIGQTAFPHQAQGSLITNEKGEVIGSRLIAQPFKGDEYFQPRPSAASYKGDASGGSNWGASNYLLRERVARQLGPMVKYGKGAEAFGKREGDGVQPDIEAWFQKDRYQGKPGIVARWAKDHPTVAQGWAKGDKLIEAYVKGWWVRENPNAPEPKVDDIAVPFLEYYSRTNPGTFPAVVDKAVQPVRTGEDIQGYFFDMWRQEHPDVPLESVPADMVMASGSGLDPHITLANAHYQLKHRVAAAQARKRLTARVEQTKPVGEAERKAAEAQLRKEWEDRFGKPLEEKIREEIEAVLREKKEAPLGGLVGVDLVNVLEVNLAMNDRLERLLPNQE